MYYFSKQQGKMIKATVDASGKRTAYARMDPIGVLSYRASSARWIPGVSELAGAAWGRAATSELPPELSMRAAHPVSSSLLLLFLFGCGAEDKEDTVSGEGTAAGDCTDGADNDADVEAQDLDGFSADDDRFEIRARPLPGHRAIL
jgi:hypothetical protein